MNELYQDFEDSKILTRHIGNDIEVYLYMGSITRVPREGKRPIFLDEQYQYDRAHIAARELVRRVRGC